MNLLRLREIYHRVAAAPAVERERLLDECCAGDVTLRDELTALLAAGERAGAFLADPTMELQPGPDRSAQREALPFPAIGAYQLLEKLGEGGYGEVFLAEQSEPVRRRVALKMLKAGLDTRQVLARFEAERQTLAMMDHPGIARIFDAGTTPQGRPFFVMEYVDGMPVTEFCLLRKVSPRERLELFCEVCRAVQHAHTRGVIHRDLKPSNILVTEVDGQPRAVVIDFGIAKAMRGMDAGATLHTGLRQLMGTPAYMSPEQAGLEGPDVDTRSDIYSLGVLLYELLTGVTPFDASQLRAAALAEVQRRLSEEIPAKPSTRVASLTASNTQTGLRADFAAPVRLLKGDLDWIVMKALEKEPARRYASAAAFAEDVVRHLGNEPVSAGPPSAIYRLRKWTKRHRAAAAAAAVALLAAGVAVGGLIYGYVVAEREVKARTKEATARKIQAERAEALLKLQDRLFRSANPQSATGKDYTVRALLDDFSVRFRQPLGVEPEVEISLRHTIARAYQMLGNVAGDKAAPEIEKPDVQLAEDHARAALALAESKLGGESRAAADCRALVGDVLRTAGRYTDARPLLESALAWHEKHTGARSAAALTARALLADILEKLDDRPRAIGLAKDAVDWPADADQDAVRPLNIAGIVCFQHHEFAAAKTAVTRALALGKAADGGEEGARCVGPLQVLAAVHIEEGRGAEGVATAERAARIALRMFGPKHSITVGAIANLNRARQRVSPEFQVLTQRKELFDTLTATLGATHPESLQEFNDLLRTALATDPKGAGSIVEQFVHAGRTPYGAEWQDGHETGDSLQQNLEDSGHARELEAPARAAVEIVLAKSGPADRNTLDLQRMLAGVFIAQKKWPAAASILTTNLEACRSAFGATDARTRECRLDLAALWDRAGNLRLRDEVLSGLGEELLAAPEDAPGRGPQLFRLWQMRADEERAAIAIPLGDAALTTLRKTGAPRGQIAYLLYYHALLHRDTGRYTRWNELMNDAREESFAAHGVKSPTAWTITGHWLEDLSKSPFWRSGMEPAPEWEVQIKENLGNADKARGIFARGHIRLREMLTEHDAAVAAARAALEQTLKESPEASRAGFGALAVLAKACREGGLLKEGRDAAERARAAIAAVPGAGQAVRDQPLMLRTWFDYYLGNITPDAAAETIRTLMARLTITEEDKEWALSLFARARDVMQDMGRLNEGLALEDAFRDRHKNAEWPAPVTVLVPRGVIWTADVSPAAPQGPWDSDATWDESFWQRVESPVGFHQSLAPASGLVMTDYARRPLRFRCVFTVPEGANYKEFKIRLRCCDGALLRLNGTELLAHNLTPERTAAAAGGGTMSDVHIVPAAALRPGRNLLSAIVYPAVKRTNVQTFCFDAVLEAR